MQAVKLSALCRQTPRKVPVGTKAAEPFCLLTATCSVRAFNTMPALATRGLGSCKRPVERGKADVFVGTRKFLCLWFVIKKSRSSTVPSCVTPVSCQATSDFHVSKRLGCGLCTCVCVSYVEVCHVCQSKPAPEVGKSSLRQRLRLLWIRVPWRVKGLAMRNAAL